jgi:hypothetical protein
MNIMTNINIIIDMNLLTDMSIVTEQSHFLEFYIRSDEGRSAVNTWLLEHEADG